jgi:hypothetical protein
MKTKKPAEFFQRVRGINGNVKFAVVGSGTSWTYYEGNDVKTAAAGDAQTFFKGSCRTSGNKTKFLVRGGEATVFKQKVIGQQLQTSQYEVKTVSDEEDERLEAVRTRLQGAVTAAIAKLPKDQEPGRSAWATYDSVLSHLEDGDIKGAETGLATLVQQLGITTPPPTTTTTNPPTTDTTNKPGWVKAEPRQQPQTLSTTPRTQQQTTQQQTQPWQAPDPEKVKEDIQKSTVKLSQFATNAEQLAKGLEKFKSSKGLPALAQKVRELAQKVQQVPQNKPEKLMLLLSQVQELSKACTDYVAEHGKEDDAQAKAAKGLKSILDGIAAQLVPSDPSTIVATNKLMDTKMDEYVASVMQARGNDPEAIKAIVLESITAELAETLELTDGTGTTAFRTDSFSSKIQKKYTEAIAGEALKGLLGGALGRCRNLTNSKDTEVEPEKLKDIPEPERSETIQRNVEKHQQMMEALIEELAQAQIPPEAKAICAHMYQEAAKKFPLDGPNAEKNKKQVLALVGGYFFLRVVTPILFNAAAGQNWQQAGIFQAKLLQNLANGVRPSIKDPHMKVFDGWFDQMQAKFKQILENLAGVS